MTPEPQTITIGGHHVEHNGAYEGIRGVARAVWHCVDCKVSGTSTLFAVGTGGCPMRPESLDYLSVCPGGELCPGHMDTSSAEWRQWKASKSMPTEQVPHLTCDADQLGIRAARQWLTFADKIGLKTRAWADTGTGVGLGGGRVAELTSPVGNHHIVVTRYGRLRVHEHRAIGCEACAELVANGEVVG